TMEWEILDAPGRRGLKLRFADEGPGIPNLELAMTDGWTSGNGLGMGLTGAKRLVNEFDIDTKVGAGTRVTIARWTEQSQPVSAARSSATSSTIPARSERRAVRRKRWPASNSMPRW